MQKSMTRHRKKGFPQTWTMRLSILISVLLLACAGILGGVAYLAAMLWILVVLALLWFGNRYLYYRLKRIYPWYRQPLRRFFIQLLVSGLYSLVCVNASYYFLKTLLMGMPPEPEQMLVLNLYGLLFIIPVISFHFGIYFMVRWKKTFIQSEKLREENLRTRLESLKTHIDPHFLFNNLNTLSSLIDKDSREAQRFLDKFSDVYRYVLQHRDEELVSLETELDFIQSYTFLFRQRLNKQLLISIIVPPQAGSRFLPPLSVQMLVENAIKHNKATTSKPLSISIFPEEKDWLVVRNTFQPKPPEPSGLPNVGLENIRKRFAYFSKRRVIVEQDEDHFTVKLPLMEWEDMENFAPGVSLE